MLEKTRILLIGPERKILSDVRKKIAKEKDYSVSLELSDGENLRVFKSGKFDLVIAGLDLGKKDGWPLVKRLKLIDPDCVIIGVDSDGIVPSEDLYLSGLYDIIAKPIKTEELSVLIKKGANVRTLLVSCRRSIGLLENQVVSLKKQNLFLSKRIEESTKNLTRLYDDLRSTYIRTIKSLAQAIDARDHYTHSHSENLAQIATVIAAEMGLSALEIENIKHASEMHDLGKIGVQDKVLTKPSGFTSQEWIQMKRHPETGAQILEPLTFLSDVIELVRQHHEHYDGSGYPKGLKGNKILLGAQIIHLADSYEAMSSQRAYRKIAMTKQEVIKEIRKHKGKQFAPRVVEAFIKVVDKL